jgi:hypothetical protein
VRHIFESEILQVDDSDSPTSYYVFHVRGSSFLYHQVRCMMAILLLIGQSREPVSLVSTLIDEEGNLGRPMYEMADESALVLAECGYNEKWFNWITDDKKCEGHVQRSIFDKVWDNWREESTRAIVDKELMMRVAESTGESVDSIVERRGEKESKRHRGLLKMKRGETLDERFAKGEWYKQQQQSIGMIDGEKSRDSLNAEE